MIESVLGQKVTLETFKAMNGAGEYTYNTGVSYYAYVDYAPEHRKRNREQTVEYVSVVYLPANVSVSTDDRITLPDASKPVIVKVHKPRDIFGNVIQTVVYCG